MSATRSRPAASLGCLQPGFAGALPPPETCLLLGLYPCALFGISCIFHRLTAAEEGVNTEGSAKVSRSSLLLDLDETALYGNDGNDLPISMQWMGRPTEDIEQLYKLLVSPCVKGEPPSFPAD